MRRDLVLGPPRDLGTVALVAGLCGAYAGALVTASSLLARLSDEGGSVGIALGIVSTVFVLIALYVAAVVIANAVDTVIAGRLRQIALLRILGATAPALRSTVTRGTAVVGGVAGLGGVVAGVFATTLFRVVQVHRGVLPDLDYPVTSVAVVAPVVAIVLTAATAGRIGARRILRVSAAAGLSQASAPSAPSVRRSRLRVLASGILIIGGALTLGVAALVGERNPAGFLVAFVGAATTGTGILVGGRIVVPRLVATLGRGLGDGVPARIARRNAVSDPLRTTRSTMGLVIGVTLVTSIVAGMRALEKAVHATRLSDADRLAAEQVLTTTTAVLLGLVAISCLISAVGFVSTMSLTVIQRRREVGLLRALGLTAPQIRSMITLESCALAGTAVLFGLVLGIVFGSVGAQSLIGHMANGFVWGLPWTTLLGITAAGVALVLAAAAPPAIRAARVTPVEALAADR